MVVVAACVGPMAKAFNFRKGKLRGGDKVDFIERGLTIRGGRSYVSFGVQLIKGNWDIERYAVAFEIHNETRETAVAKYRRLADAIETGEGAVFGFSVLSGSEINAGEIPGIDARQPDAEEEYLAGGFGSKRMVKIRYADMGRSEREDGAIMETEIPTIRGHAKITYRSEAGRWEFKSYEQCEKCE